MADELSGDYWRAVLERLLKTFVQSLLAASGVAVATLVATGATSAWDVNWWAVLGNAVLAAVLSFLTSLASTYFGPSRGPSLAGEVLTSEGGGRHRRREVPGGRPRADDTQEGPTP